MSQFLKPFAPAAMRKRGNSVSSSVNDENSQAKFGGGPSRKSNSTASGYASKSSTSISTSSRNVLGDVSNNRSYASGASSKGGFKAGSSSSSASTKYAVGKSSKQTQVKKKSTKSSKSSSSSSGASSTAKLSTTVNPGREQAKEIQAQQDAFNSYFSKLRVEDVDGNDVEDPQCATAYLEEIHDYMRRNEIAYLPNAKYMEEQVDINEKMRAILVDWLIEVHLKFKLVPETLYLTINYIDRFLCLKQVVRSKLQLVGVTAMFIASKYEEIYAPEVNDFVYICDNAYTKHEILEMEKLMLASLDFNLTVATHLNFSKRITHVAALDEEATHMCNYFVELALPYSKMLVHKPSKIAAAAVYLTMRIVHPRKTWNQTLQYHSRYTEEDLLECASDMRELVLKAPKSSMKAVSKKYAKSAFMRVANIDFSQFEW